MVFELKLGEKGKVIPTACEWKEAVPYATEQKILCVTIGNSNYKWAMMQADKENYVPIVMWRTPPITAEEMKTENPTQSLTKHLPSQVMEEIFGSVDIFDSARANQYAAARKIPARSIYVISTNRDGERAVMYAFSDIRHRMFRVESKDFFSKADGCYDTFGVDRAACLYGGFRITSEALLVIDGGTAMTYTGLDAKGKIMGGGISPGIGARFRCLSDYCGRLPLYTYEHYNEQREFPAFATDTKTSMIASTLQEVSLHTQNIVKLFLKELKKRASDDDSDEKQKEPKLVSEKKKVVFVTGGDAIFLKRSLGQSDDLPMSQIEIKEMKYLPTYGIGHLIQAKSNEVGIPTPDEQLRLRLLGQRVAREFPIPDTEGDSIYRGSIVGFLPGEDNVEGDLYAVRYDDGDKEECSLDQVYDALMQYVLVGEKESQSPEIWSTERTEEHKRGAEDSAKQLLEGVPTLKATLKKKAEKKKAKAKAIATATAMAVLPPIETTENGNPNPAKRPRSPEGTESSLGAAKKAKPESESNVAVVKYLGQGVAKVFPIENEKGELEDTIYYGVVESYEQESKFWHIRYEDGDEEDFDEIELKKALELDIEHRGEDV